MKKLLLMDDLLELLVTSISKPKGIILRAIRPWLNVSIEAPCVKTPTGIRPVQRGEIQTGYVSVSFKQSNGSFHIEVTTHLMDGSETSTSINLRSKGNNSIIIEH